MSGIKAFFLQLINQLFPYQHFFTQSEKFTVSKLAVNLNYLQS